jgi:hypothetical protein
LITRPQLAGHDHSLDLVDRVIRDRHRGLPYDRYVGYAGCAALRDNSKDVRLDEAEGGQLMTTIDRTSERVRHTPPRVAVQVYALTIAKTGAIERAGFWLEAARERIDTSDV